MAKKLFSRNIIIGIVVVIILLVLGAYYGAGYVIYDQLTAVEPRCERAWMEGKRDNTPTYFLASHDVGDPLVEMPQYFMPDYEDVTLSPRDEDLTLSGWFIPAPEASDNVILIVHGIHSCKQDSTVLIPAGMLHHGGYNVMIVELRNHGASEIVDGRNAVGSREYRDVLGAFDYLQERGFEADNIGVLGISFGGSTATIAFGQEPAIPALFLDSPFGDLDALIANELALNGIPAFLGSPALQISRLNGVPIDLFSPDEEISKHNGRPIMIVHGTDDPRVPFEFGEQVYDNAGDNAGFVAFEGAQHVEAMHTNTAEYEAVLLEFFNSVFLDNN